MPEQEDNNLNTIPITPKASAWNKWKVLAIVNSIVIVGLATAMIIFIQNFKTGIDNSAKTISNQAEWISWLASQDEFYTAKTFDLHSTNLQQVNAHLAVTIIKAGQFIDGQKLTIGILNTSGVALSDIRMKITKKNNTDSIDLNYLNKIPAGFMRLTTVVLPKDYVGQSLQIAYENSSTEYRIIP
jgi:hypothetical protein